MSQAGYPEPTPRQVLETYCYTSERTFDGTIYTIEDQRTNYNGKQIISKLIYGEYILSWVNG